VLCILGPNGAGKTTLLKTLLGLRPVDAGDIRLYGRRLSDMSLRAIARQMAYVPQSSIGPHPLSVGEMVLMGRTPHIDPIAIASSEDERLAQSALERLGIASLRNRRFDEISGGERQLVLIARALCQQARLLVLDEPTAHLDYGNQIRVLQVVKELREEGYAVIMTAHNPDHALLVATNVTILDRAHLSAGGEPNSVITTERLSALYRTPIRVLKADVTDEPGLSVTACVPLLTPGAGALHRQAVSTNAADRPVEGSRRKH